MNRLTVGTPFFVKLEDESKTIDQNAPTNNATVAQKEGPTDIHERSQADGQANGSHQPLNEGQSLLFQVGKVAYNDFSIRIYTDSEDTTKARRFLFEPVVLLDQKSITVQSQGLFQQDVVCFSIQMWNQEIRSKVLDLLRLKNFQFDEDEVSVVPYENVQLVGKPGSFHTSINIFEEPKPYHRLNQKLNFFLLCDSAPTAHSLAENLRQYPEFVMNKWQLSLECRDLVLNPLNEAVKLVNKFTVSTLSVEDATPQDENVQPLTLAGLRAELLQTMLATTAVPVFSVKTCTNPAAERHQSLSFSSFDFDTRADYGDFDIQTGIFTIKTAGIFQFNFVGLVQIVTKELPTHQFELRVDGATKAICFANSSSETKGYQNVVISTFIELEVGQKVGMYLQAGKLHDAPNTCTTRFSSIFFSGK